ncbi:MAG: hypothetical protein QM676_03355 [Novosphingobium sp.]
MSRQLAFSSTISVMVMAAFALSATVKAQDLAARTPPAPVVAASGR